MHHTNKTSIKSSFPRFEAPFTKPRKRSRSMTERCSHAVPNPPQPDTATSANSTEISVSPGLKTGATCTPKLPPDVSQHAGSTPLESKSSPPSAVVTVCGSTPLPPPPPLPHLASPHSSNSLAPFPSVAVRRHHSLVQLLRASSTHRLQERQRSSAAIVGGIAAWDITGEPDATCQKDATGCGTSGGSFSGLHVGGGGAPLPLPGTRNSYGCNVACRSTQLTPYSDGAARTADAATARSGCGGSSDRGSHGCGSDNLNEELSSSSGHPNDDGDGEGGTTITDVDNHSAAASATSSVGPRKSLHFHPRSLRQPHHRAFHLAWAGGLVSYMAAFAPAALLPILRSDLWLRFSDVGFAAVAALVAPVLTLLPASLLACRYGPRYCQILILLVAATLLASAPLVNSTGGFILVRLLLGAMLGMATVTQCWVAAMFDNIILGRTTAAATGLSEAGSGLVMVFLPLLYGGLQHLYDGNSTAAWRACFQCMAGLPLLVALLTFVYGQDTPSGDLLDPKQYRNPSPELLHRNRGTDLEENGCECGPQPHRCGSSSSDEYITGPSRSMAFYPAAVTVGARYQPHGVSGTVLRLPGQPPTQLPSPPLQQPQQQQEQQQLTWLHQQQLMRQSLQPQLPQVQVQSSSMAPPPPPIIRPWPVRASGAQQAAEAGAEWLRHKRPSLVRKPVPGGMAPAPAPASATEVPMARRTAIISSLPQPAPAAHDAIAGTTATTITTSAKCTATVIVATGDKLSTISGPTAAAATTATLANNGDDNGGAEVHLASAAVVDGQAPSNSKTAGTAGAAAVAEAVAAAPLPYPSPSVSSGYNSPSSVDDHMGTINDEDRAHDREGHQDAGGGKDGVSLRRVGHHGRLCNVVLRSPICWLLALNYGLAHGSQLVAFNTLPLYLKESFGLGMLRGGVVAGVFGLLSLFTLAAGHRLAATVSLRLAGMRSRLWLLWGLQTTGGTCCALLGAAGQRDSLAACCALLVLFALTTQQACGVALSITPFVSYRSYTAVAAIVTAAAHVGAAILQGAFFNREGMTYSYSFELMGITVAAASLSLLLLRFPMWSSMLVGPDAEAADDEWAEERYYAREWTPAERAQGLAAVAAGFARLSKAERGLRGRQLLLAQQQ